MADAEPTVPPRPSIPPCLPSPKERGMILDYLAGLKELCKNKEAQGPPLIVMKKEGCTNAVTEEHGVYFLHDAFESPENFMWHSPTRSLVRIYESQDSTEDHTVMFYEKRDNHRVVMMRIPYEDTEFVGRMAARCVNVMCL